jgi:hypothetical protein
LVKYILIIILICLTGCSNSKAYDPLDETRTKLEITSSKLQGGLITFEGRDYVKVRQLVPKNKVGQKIGTVITVGDVYEIKKRDRLQIIVIDSRNDADKRARIERFERYDFDNS